MKTLQNNFTTPEQSNRLLKLGVPADSCDCQYYAVSEEWGWEKPALRDESKPLGYNCTPCWSVGRLIEIFVIARGYEDGLMSIDGRNSIEYLIRLFAMNRDEKFKLDFSKLED